MYVFTHLQIYEWLLWLALSQLMGMKRLLGFWKRCKIGDYTKDNN